MRNDFLHGNPVTAATLKLAKRQESVRGCHVNLAPARREAKVGFCSGRSCRLPILKRFASESAERISGNEMALGTLNAFWTAA